MWKIDGKSIKGLKITVMGLGLHGGGLESALFFARQGAEVTVTDMRDSTVLAPSIEKLKSSPVRFVLGRHEERDFRNADIVVKNPGVRPDSHFLAVAQAAGTPVETDISIFLALSNNTIIAVTGSKGKSTTASAIHYCLKRKYPETRLGGNITVSPLSFLEDIQPEAIVVLELSSWQLADLKNNRAFKPKVSIITNILPDHMNRYGSMQEYVADKKVVYEMQEKEDFSVFNFTDPFTHEFMKESRAQCFFFSETSLPEGVNGAWLEDEKGYIRIGEETGCILKKDIQVRGSHNRLNLICSGIALRILGLELRDIAESLCEFPGIEHRLEFFYEKKGVLFYNDSAATIPHAVVEALKSLEGDIILITGGTDKNIDFSPLREIVHIPRKIILLEGSATVKIMNMLKTENTDFDGPFNNLFRATARAFSFAKSGTRILFSPGCASFGMFLNEFDRGKRFKKIVHSL